MPFSRELRLLVVTHHITAGFGGTPESVLLLANHLKAIEVSVDVLSAEGLSRDIGERVSLPSPENHESHPRRELNLSHYQAVLIAGSWNPSAISVSSRARRMGIPVSYAAKGNLCKVEFSRPRDSKKLLYLVTLELIPLALARTVVFSSNLERESTIIPATLLKRKQIRVVPEPFRILVQRRTGSLQEPEKSDGLTLGFLAEISPRKGLMELVAGFLKWLDEGADIYQPRLRVAGDPRPGSERYLERVKSYARHHPLGGAIGWEVGKRGKARTDFYRQVDIFACPSRFESFGLTPLEALWEGTPVVCGPRIGALEYLPNATCLGIFKSLTPRQIAAELEVTRTDLAKARTEAMVFREEIVRAFGGKSLTKSFASALFLNAGESPFQK